MKRTQCAPRQRNEQRETKLRSERKGDRKRGLQEAGRRRAEPHTHTYTDHRCKRLLWNVTVTDREKRKKGLTVSVKKGLWKGTCFVWRGRVPPQVGLPNTAQMQTRKQGLRAPLRVSKRGTAAVLNTLRRLTKLSFPSFLHSWS